MDNEKKMQKFLLGLLIFEVFTEVAGGIFGLSELRILGRYLVSGALTGCVMVWIYCAQSIPYAVMWLLNLALEIGLVSVLYLVGHSIGISLLCGLLAFWVLFFRVSDIARLFILVLNALYAKFEIEGDALEYAEGLEKCRSFPASNRLSIYVSILDKRILLKNFLLVYEIYSLEGEEYRDQREKLQKQAEQIFTSDQISVLLSCICNAQKVKDEMEASYPESHMTWEQMMIIAIRRKRESVFLSIDTQAMICARCDGQGFVVEKGQKVVTCPVCHGVGYYKMNGDPFTKSEQMRALWKNFMLPLFILLLGVIGAFVFLQMTIFSDRFQAFFLCPNGTVLEILHAYADWYIMEICMVLVGLVICVLPQGILKYLVKVKQSAQKRLLFVVFIWFFGIYVIFGFAMLLDHQPALLYTQAKEDIAQVESGQMQAVTVWLSPKSRPSALPPYDKNMPKSFTRYGGISYETEGEWVKFYVPNSLDFSLAQDALYNEEKSVEWNIRHAVQYEVIYTKNFHVVTEIHPIPLEDRNLDDE